MRIAILALPHAQMLDVAGPLDVFSEAALAAGAADFYQLEVIGIDRQPIVGSSGLRMLPHRAISDRDEPIDTLLVAGSHTIGTFAEDPNIQTWLRRQSVLARRYGSICNGTFALAAAGLLDGCRVTTHWNCADELAARYPAIQVEPNRIYAKCGPVYTSAGITAGIDLALALVEEDLGRDVALHVARRVVFLKRPQGQTQFCTNLAGTIATKSTVGHIQNWILENISVNHTVNSLAKRAGMSLRNFSRVFRRETGTTPADFIESSRIDAARRMIEETNFPLKLIASRCGFGSRAALRRAFLRRLGVNPHSYCEKFRLAA